MSRPRLVWLLAFLPLLCIFAFLVYDTWFLCEDAFITFRYARNLMEGHGLVFNPGERVEGYTNLLWLLELSALWRIGLRPEYAAHVLSLLFTAGTLWLVARLVWRVTEGKLLAVWMAIGLLATSTTFAVWTTGGLETRQFTFFALLGVYWLWRDEHRQARVVLASLALAAAALTRPEGLMLWGCCVVWLAFTARQSLLRAILPFAVLVGAHFVFRYVYYDEFLPNTYYAKHVRAWYESGGRYLGAAALETGLYVLVPLACIAVLWRRSHALSLLCVLSHLAYLAHIGGDHFEHRPMDFYWPLLAVAVADTLCRLRWVGMSLYLALLLYCGGLQGTIWMQSRGLNTRAETSRLHLDVTPENAPWLHYLPGMPWMTRASNHLRLANLKHLVGIRAREHAIFARDRIRHWSPYEAMPRGFLPKDAVAATGAAGVMPFYLSDLVVIDLLGLADKVVARNPVEAPNSERMMGHDRRPPLGYREQRGVNIEIRVPASSPEVALQRGAYAVLLSEGFWMPFDSSDAAWVERAFAGKELRRR